MNNSSTHSTKDLENKVKIEDATINEMVDQKASQSINPINDYQVIGQEENKYYKGKVVTITKTIIK